MKIEILMENEDFLILNKPAGLMVHSDGRSAEETLVDWLVSHYPSIKGVGEPPIQLKTGSFKLKSIERPGIVHRLDKGTSGVMVVAKNQKTFEYLKNLFKTHQVEKTYHAIVWGNFKNNTGIIEKPIGRSKKDFRRWTSLKDAGGEMREARTDYEVMERFKNASLVKVMPKTGRTHQIRVHMKAIDHPLLSDELYGPDRQHIGGLDRPALHSYSIKFQSEDGKQVEAGAEYPADFTNCLLFLRQG